MNVLSPSEMRGDIALQTRDLPTSTSGRWTFFFGLMVFRFTAPAMASPYKDPAGPLAISTLPNQAIVDVIQGGDAFRVGNRDAVHTLYPLPVNCCFHTTGAAGAVAARMLNYCGWKRHAGSWLHPGTLVLMASSKQPVTFVWVLWW